MENGPPLESDFDDFDDDFGIRRPPLSAEEEAQARKFLAPMRTPLAPGDPRRHHFIPQSFLKRFADENDQLAVLRLDDNESYDVTSITNVAVMKDLYTIIDEEIGETVMVERLLAHVDGKAKAAIDRLILGVFFPPSPPDRMSLAEWIALLAVRDPHSRRSNEALADHAFKLDLSLVHDESTARARLRENMGREPTDTEVEEMLDAVSDLDSFEITPHQNDLVQLMLDAATQIMPCLFGRYTSVVRFDRNGLVLSDRPVVPYQKPVKRMPGFGVGFGNADEIWLPLDRRTLLILHSDPVVVDRILDAPPNFSIDVCNQQLIQQTTAEIYCHPDDLRRLEQLDLPDPDRPLFTVTGADWMRGGTDGVNQPATRKRHRRYRRIDR